MAHSAHVICTVMHGLGVVTLARVCRETSVEGKIKGDKD
eukprot:COSAG02_NODE_7842_length_2823_cov_1.637665_6_plen_38_part_01